MARKRNAETITLADHLRSIASKGGAARAAALTPKERRDISALGASAGGKARAAKLSPAQLKKIASNAAKARWKRAKKPKG
jgi:hypothetical protein